jgi:hypothetical protein
VAHSPPARVHGAAARRRRAHLGHLQGDQSRTQPGRRGGPPLRAGGRSGGRRAAVRRGAVSRLQPGFARCGAACACARCKTWSTTRCCTCTGQRGCSTGARGWRRRVRRPQARRVAQVRRVRADDRRGAEWPGVAMGIGRLVSGLLQEGRLVAPFSKSVVGERAYLRDPLVADGHAAACAGVRGLADRRGEDRGRCTGPGRAQLPTTSGEVSGAKPRARSAR